MTIKLYSTNCPKCNVLEKKLDQKNIPYEKITDFDVQEFIKKGLATAPILFVDGSYLKFNEAVSFINTI